MSKKKTELELKAEMIQEELQGVVAEYEQAVSNFNYAKAEYVPIAIDLLRAAEIKLDAECKKCKVAYEELGL